MDPNAEKPVERRSECTCPQDPNNYTPDGRCEFRLLRCAHFDGVRVVMWEDLVKGSPDGYGTYSVCGPLPDATLDWDTDQYVHNVFENTFSWYYPGQRDRAEEDFHRRLQALLGREVEP